MDLTDRHIRAITERAKPDNNKKTDAAIAKACGMHRTTYWRIMQTTEAREMLQDKINQFTALSRPRVIGALERNALKGDNNAIRTYLQYTGDIGTGGHTTNVSVTQNNNEDLDDRAADIWTRRAAALTQDES